MAHAVVFPKFRAFDADGDPLNGGKLYSYIAGSSTPQATYTDKAAGTANTNPVVLDANGEANVWLSDALNYKLVLTDADDVVLWTVDNVSNINDGSIALAKLADGILANSTAGRLKMADGYLSATSDGLAKMAAGYLSATSDGLAKMAAGFLQASTDGLAKMADDYFSATSGARAKFASGFFTKAMMPAVGQQISSSTSVSITQHASYQGLMSVSITTTGRPVFVGFTNGRVLFSNAANYVAGVNIQILRGVTVLRTMEFFANSGTSETEVSGSAELQGFYIDAPAAGTYTYTAQGIKSDSSDTATLQDGQLVAFEL